ncbi:U-box domain-containing protein 27-like [Senna tora]|uniref:U-box domain-containing protein n=1 Tax=Senna tora TaxID=362788 RepID=A0A834X9A7_9FABA|nr:U-box domain-containing protein 27-like [Senna tora]
MVRDDLYITVPSFFRCPISLDVMKSPVSLCTGVTYDRSSIQRWLDNGNNTCPATMDMEDGRRMDSLTGIVYFAEESEENREFLAKSDGFVPMLVGLLNDNVDSGVEFLEKVVSALDLILNKIENREQLKRSMLKSHDNCLDSLLLVLKQGSSTNSKIGSARILKFIAVDTESKIMIAEKDGVVSELLKSIAPEEDPALIENGLSCLAAISTPKRNKFKVVHLGAIKTLSRLLSGSNWSVSVTEKVLKLLETVSSTKEGRSEICEDPSCVAAILQKVLKVSSVATEHAVTILWCVCCLFREQKAQEAMIMANGMTKILLLMQSNCSPAVRQMSAELLKILRVNSKYCLSCYDTKTTHIMPF